MNTLIKGLVLSCVPLLLTGCCGVTGHWQTESIVPESAESDFHFGMLCLGKDGAYQACATVGGEAKAMSGTYKYDRPNKTLTFTGSDGKERTYHVQFSDLGHEMTVTPTEKGKEWTATLERAACPCGKKGCGGDAKKCDMSKCDPAKCAGCKEAPQKAEPAKAEPKKAEPKKAEPGKPAEPKKAPTTQPKR